MDVKDVVTGTGEGRKAYAVVAEWGAALALPLLLVAFAVYVLGLLPPRVPFEEMVRCWDRPASEFLAAQDLHGGWSWVLLLNRGDYLNYLPIALLGTVSIAALARALAAYVRIRDRLAASVCAAEILVLLLSVSGVLVIGH